MKKWAGLGLCVILIIGLCACAGQQPDIQAGDVYQVELGEGGVLELSFTEEAALLCRATQAGERETQTVFTWVFDSETQLGSLYSENSAQEFRMVKKGQLELMGYCFVKK